jgi:heme-binding NEAT domain protein
MLAIQQQHGQAAQSKNKPHIRHPGTTTAKQAAPLPSQCPQHQDRSAAVSATHSSSMLLEITRCNCNLTTKINQSLLSALK